MVLSKLGTGLSSTGDTIAVGSIHQVPPSPAGKVGSSMSSMKYHSAGRYTAFSVSPAVLEIRFSVFQDFVLSFVANATELQHIILGGCMLTGASSCRRYTYSG